MDYLRHCFNPLNCFKCFLFITKNNTRKAKKIMKIYDIYFFNPIFNHKNIYTNSVKIHIIKV